MWILRALSQTTYSQREKVNNNKKKTYTLLFGAETPIYVKKGAFGGEMGGETIFKSIVAWAAGPPLSLPLKVDQSDARFNVYSLGNGVGPFPYNP